METKPEKKEEKTKTKEQKTHWWTKLSKKEKTILLSSVGGLLLVLVFGIVFFALGKDGEKEVKNTNTNTTKTQNKNTTEDTTTQRHLDGITVEKGKENNYPVAIMIENLSTIRPQSGLSDASIVYEALVEGGITRFMAIYDIQAKTIKEIGPVRSSRPYYVDWVSEYDALYAHAGGSPEALQAISAFQIKDLNQIAGASPNFWRDPKIAAPHNLFTSTDLMLYGLRDKGLQKERPPFKPWTFLTKEEKESVDTTTPEAQKVTIDFSSAGYQVEYNYNAEKKTYARSNGGQEHKDKNTKETIQVKNIAIVVIPEIVSYGEKGRLTLNLHGEGDAYIIRDGKKIVGRWKKADRLARTEFFDADGEKIPFAPGNIWVEVVPKDKPITIQ